MAILWGEMIFPAVVPVVLAAASQEGSMSMFAAIPACNFPKRMFAEVPLPVINVPICTIPDSSMSADIPTRAMTMITVLRICTRVLPNNLNCLLVLTPCICPPIKAPAKSNKLVALKLKGMASNIKKMIRP